MTEAFEPDAELQREMLAGNDGRCSDYKRTSTFGQTREPFTWLSMERQEDDNQSLVAELQDLQRSHGAARFEAWEVENEQWQIIDSGEVNVLYVEFDSRIGRVRALLQWAPAPSADRTENLRQSVGW